MKKTIMEAVKPLSHTPQYKMHKYFARRPYNVFSNLISHYTDKGNIVLDIFCGGGVTIFESCKLQRNAIGIDLNPLATFITRMQMFNGNLEKLIKTINEFIKNNLDDLSILYHIDFGDDKGICKWIEWAYVVECPNCGNNIILTEENKLKNGIYKCDNNTCIYKDGIARVKCKAKTSEPIRVKYISDYTNDIKLRYLTPKEKEIIINLEDEINKKLEEYKYPSFDFPLNWDRQKEDKLLEKGIKKYSDLFSNRNLYVLSAIFDKILKENNNIYTDYLYFIFSSSLRYTNKMSKVTENWEGGNPICMDKHAYYLPNTYIENNVIDVFKERAKAIINGCAYSKNNLPNNCVEKNNNIFNKKEVNYLIINGSSNKLPLDDESIDIIITDPPYGSNVQYAELSVVWNAWYQLYAKKDNYIYRDEEAVSNRKRNYNGAKDENDYERILYGIYKEAYRVLKNGSYMVFTFNNKNLNVWLAMLRAVAKSGFKLAENGVLFQDFISSYKNTSHLKYAGNVQGDFIYTFIKKDNTNIKNYNNKDLNSIIDDSIKKAIRISFSKEITKVKSEVLYKNLFTILASNLMEYIIYEQSIGNNIDDLKFEEKFVDDHIVKYLKYNNGYWKKRGE